MNIHVRIIKCRHCGQRLGTWTTRADGVHVCGMCQRPDDRSPARPGSFRIIVWGEGKATTLVWIIDVSESGVVVKPNPWALRPGDRRAGWTKPMSCKVGVVQRDRPTLHAIDEVVSVIGQPPGGGHD